MSFCFYHGCSLALFLPWPKSIAFIVNSRIAHSSFLTSDGASVVRCQFCAIMSASNCSKNLMNSAGFLEVDSTDTSGM